VAVVLLLLPSLLSNIIDSNFVLDVIKSSDGARGRSAGESGVISIACLQMFIPPP